MQANVKIRNDAGETLENKDVTLIFHFTENSKNLQKCQGFQYTSYGSGLEMVKGFSTFINTSNWQYSSESSNNLRTVYSNASRFAYFPRNSNNMIQANRELVLIKYSTGSQAILIVGYDGTNTLVVTVN